MDTQPKDSTSGNTYASGDFVVHFNRDGTPWLHEVDRSFFDRLSAECILTKGGFDFRVDEVEPASAAHLGRDDLWAEGDVLERARKALLLRKKHNSPLKAAITKTEPRYDLFPGETPSGERLLNDFPPGSLVVLKNERTGAVYEVESHRMDPDPQEDGKMVCFLVTDGGMLDVHDARFATGQELVQYRNRKAQETILEAREGIEDARQAIKHMARAAARSQAKIHAARVSGRPNPFVQHRIPVIGVYHGKRLSAQITFPDMPRVTKMHRLN